MSDPALCHHGRVIACGECVDEERKECAKPEPPAPSPDESVEHLKYACRHCLAGGCGCPCHKIPRLEPVPSPDLDPLRLMAQEYLASDYDGKPETELRLLTELLRRAFVAGKAAADITRALRGESK